MCAQQLNMMNLTSGPTLSPGEWIPCDSRSHETRVVSENWNIEFLLETCITLAVVKIPMSTGDPKSHQWGIKNEAFIEFKCSAKISYYKF